jgi:hypothetical protein
MVGCHKPIPSGRKPRVGSRSEAGLLGHSDPRVTMSIYTQVLDNEIDDVGVLLSKAASF